MNKLLLKPLLGLCLLLLTSVGSVSATASEYTHTVQRGDTLESIAWRYGLSVTALLDANDTVGRQTQLFAGRELNIPKTLDTTVKWGEPFLYEVQGVPGVWAESWGVIGYRFEVFQDYLQMANPNVAQLEAGMTILIPAGPRVIDLDGTETLADVAKRYDMSENALRQANPNIATSNRLIIPLIRDRNLVTAISESVVTETVPVETTQLAATAANNPTPMPPVQLTAQAIEMGWAPSVPTLPEVAGPSQPAPALPSGEHYAVPDEGKTIEIVAGGEALDVRWLEPIRVSQDHGNGTANIDMLLEFRGGEPMYQVYLNGDWAAISDPKLKEYPSGNVWNYVEFTLANVVCDNPTQLHAEMLTGDGQTGFVINTFADLCK